MRLKAFIVSLFVRNSNRTISKPNMKNSNRTKGFFFSSTPLSSKRGSMAISDPEQSKILIKAIREARRSNDSTPRPIGFSKDFEKKLIEAV